MSSGNGPGGDNDEGQDGQGGQTGGQPAQGGQPGQAAGTAAGQSGQGARPRGQPGGAPGAGVSATDVLSQPAGQETLKYVVGLFAILAVGTGLFTFLAGEILSNNDFTRTPFLQVVFAFLLYGGVPLVGAVLAAQDRFAVTEYGTQNYTLAFVSGLVGHVAFVFVGGIFTALAVDNFEFVDALVLGVVLGIGTGVVAAGVTWLSDQTRLPAA